MPIELPALTAFKAKKSPNGGLNIVGIIIWNIQLSSSKIIFYFSSVQRLIKNKYCFPVAWLWPILKNLGNLILNTPRLLNLIEWKFVNSHEPVAHKVSNLGQFFHNQVNKPTQKITAPPQQLYKQRDIFIPGVSQKQFPWKANCSLDIKAIILGSDIFNSGHVQINVTIYLTKMGYPVLNLLGIFSRASHLETFKTNLDEISSLKL